MKVRGQIISGEPTPDQHYQYEDIEEANHRILELEEKLYVQSDEILQFGLKEEFYKKKITLLEKKLSEKDISIEELKQKFDEMIQINNEHNKEIKLLMEDIRKEKEMSYYQMLTSAVSTAACVITMYFGIKRVVPQLGWMK